ncbi:MAG: hypothetical protein JNM70_04875 [Anaerolineae bacterium]|nr:hypothetical protein [Anaerolineae bacterium]
MKRLQNGLSITGFILLLVVGVSQTIAIVPPAVQRVAATLPATPFPTVVPDFTPVYVQKNNDQIETFLRLMNTPNCELPCLWGMTPGVSTRTELYTLLEDNHLLNNIDYGGRFLFANEGELPAGVGTGEGVGFSFQGDFNLSARVAFISQGEMLSDIRLYADRPFDWHSLTDSPLSLARVLARIDSIPEIYIYTGGPHQLFTNDVPIYFLYRREGIFLQYVFDFSNEWDWYGPPLFKTCPGLAQTRRMEWWLWNGSRVSSQEYFEQRTGSPDAYTNYPTIDQVLGVSAATFVEYFRKYPDGCIESVVSSDY